MDDIPDLPPSPNGAFDLPSVPSEKLSPEARTWVARFMPTPGSAPPEPLFPHTEAFEEPVVPRIQQVVEKTASPPQTAASASPRPSRPVEEPPAPSQAAPPEPPAPVLRADAARRSRGSQSWITIIAVTVAVLAVLALLIRERPFGRREAQPAVQASMPAPSAAETENRQAAAPSPSATAPPAVENPSASGASTETPARAAAPAVASPATPDSRPASSAATPAASEPGPEPSAETRTGRFALEVGSYMFEDRAQAERSRLATRGHRAFVVTDGESSSAVYRVFIGPFKSQSGAEHRADHLLSKGIVQQARVVSLTGSR